jgi:iron-sulfur cluster assembly accessory protein
MTEAAATDLVEISESAVKKITELLSEEENADYALRFQVVGGGCAGFQYNLAFDNDFADDDEIVTISGIKVVVDALSARYVEGATVDYVEGEMGAGFKIENPNVTSTCGCGSSHSF